MCESRIIKTFLFIVITLAGCSPDGGGQGSLPTLMVLPSETLETLGSEMLPPSPLPATARQAPIATQTRTPSPEPTATPEPPPPSATASPTLPDCNIEGWLDAITPDLVEFLDTAEVAVRTSRMSMSPVILELQRVMRRIERVEYPACSALAYMELMNALTSAVNGMNEFLASNDTLSERNFTRANQSMYDFGSALDALSIYRSTPQFELLERIDDRLRAPDRVWGGIPVGFEMTATVIRNFNNTVEAQLAATQTARRILAPTRQVQIAATQTAEVRMQLALTQTTRAQQWAGTATASRNNALTRQAVIRTPTPSPNPDELTATALISDVLTREILSLTPSTN